VTQPTRILFVIDQLSETLGGAERILMKTVAALPSDRFQCRIVTFSVPSRLPEGIPCPIDVLPLRRTYDARAVGVARELLRIIREHSIQIVHTFFETSDLWAGGLVKLFTDARLISSRRDMGILRDRKHHLAYRLMGPRFDRVLAVSNQVAGYCRDKDRIQESRVITLYNGISLEGYAISSHEVRKKFDLPQNAFVIGCVSNIRRVKGIDVLARAAAYLSSRLPSALFAVAGHISEPGYFGEVKALITETGLEAKFRFLGNVTEVGQFLKACDAYCMLSRSEGFSNSLLEAMAAGLPCVVTNVGGNGEAITNGETGFLVVDEGASEAAERILQIFRDRIAAHAMGLRAQQSVKTRFSFDAMIQQLADIYGEVLSE
jgi:glycosyltransferase involved in cell wall biosynthesis